MKQKIGIIALLALGALASRSSFADDASILRFGDPRVRAAEEAFILAGKDPPLLEQPVLSGRLRRELLSLDSPEALRIASELAAPKGHIAFVATTNLAGDYSGTPNRDATIMPTSIFDTTKTANDLLAAAASSNLSSVFIPSGTAAAQGRDIRSFRTSESMGEALAVPSVLDLRLRLIVDPLVLDIDPEIRQASNWYRNGGPWDLNYALFSELSRMDINVPSRGIASFLSGPFEFRAGRDKLQIGPGRASTLSINAAIPWTDFAEARADAGPISMSFFYIRLNPYLTDDERYYMDAVYAYPGLRADPTAYYELIHTEAEKNLAISRLTWRICPLATFVLTQHNLVAGRAMQLSDLNPLSIYHNLFQEGVYAVPIMLEASAVPLRGLRLYGQYLLYDAVVADETSSNTDNAGASAYQAGLTWLLPIIPEARLRLDAEATLTDAWVYGKAYSLRQFTSRFVFVEPFHGRFWVDYPIGPSFGPDCADLDLRLSLGQPEGWELTVSGGWRQSGSINLVGYGDGSSYAHQSDYHRDGLVFVKNGQSPETRLRLGLEASSPSIVLGSFSLGAKAMLQSTWARDFGFVQGTNRWWADASIAATLSYGTN